MLKRDFATFWRDENAAIAPLYALALFGLIGIAGVGWDYGRLMAMDSELQNAADQAALAAATQLDGSADAMSRARDAANDFLGDADSEWANQTRTANDGQGRPITGMTFRFYESYDSDTDEFGDEVEDDADGALAKVVQVTVDGREVFYALTPVVGAISSGDIEADAVAGLETATCNVPPLMFCAPSAAFPGDADVGKGISMHMRANQSDIWAPGNFGFLDIDYEVPNGEQNHLTGLNSDYLGCAGDDVESRTGSRTPEMRALNTRFDMYENGGQTNCDGNGNFCPSQSSRKNYVVAQSFNNSTTHPSALTCNSSPSGTPTWVDVSTTSAADVPATTEGFPMDTGMGTGTFGNGTWALSDYMSAAHSGTTLPSTADLDNNGSISRYEVYEWELDDAASRLQPRKAGYDITGTSTTGPKGSPVTRYDGVLYCAYPQPVTGTAVVPSPTQKDRRVITVAAVDCTDLNGHAPVDILRWVDLFLVQPASTTGTDKSFFAEVMGAAETPGGEESAFQYYGRNKPVLLR